MRLPHPPSGVTRFFARPLSGVLECPRCGTILFFNSSGGGGRVQNAGWDKRTSMVHCHGCQLRCVIGLIAWPVVQGSWGRTLPRDQVPGERELAQLRAMEGGKGAGWWMPKSEAKKAKRPDDTNVTARCTCVQTRDGSLARIDPACPLHGDYEAEGGLGEGVGVDVDED